MPTPSQHSTNFQPPRALRFTRQTAKATTSPKAPPSLHSASWLLLVDDRQQRAPALHAG